MKQSPEEISSDGQEGAIRIAGLIIRELTAKGGQASLEFESGSVIAVNPLEGWVSVDAGPNNDEGQSYFLEDVERIIGELRPPADTDRNSS